MAKQSGVPSGGHTPVSNAPTESDFPEVKSSESQDPSEGTDAKASKPRDNGTENVPGHHGLEAAAAPAAAQAPDTSGLRDIGEASFGPPSQLETVHGVDNRVQITATASYPWRVHASLLITAADNSMWIGTGWFIGPHTLMTAGHVVHIKNSGVPGRDGWVKKIVVMPGRNGSTLPYGSVTSSTFRSVTGWTTSGDENYDYGAIILPVNTGNTVGLVRLRGLLRRRSGGEHREHLGLSGRQAGRDAVVRLAQDRLGQLAQGVLRHRHRGRAERQCGLPDHRQQPLRRGDPRLRRRTTNSGTRIVKPVFDNMVAWKA